MRRVALLLSLLAASPVDAQLGTRDEVPVPMPERPFLLVDARRRFVPSEPAGVRIQLRDGGEVSVAVFRVREPASLLGQAGRRQGVSLATTRIGEEAEELLVQTNPLPRTGSALSLLRERRVSMPQAEGLHRVANETVVYDSNEDVVENVATYWVNDGNWSVRDVSLGRLRPGLYLVQVRAAAWVSSALLSVGDLVVLARRGDERDVVRVTDAEGAPQEGVTVRAFSAEHEVVSQQTDANGVTRFAASGREALRFRAERGPDVAWVDVAHVRLAPCDPRVYVATGRPVYRLDERMFVRGQVRGCEGDGYAGLSGRTVTLQTSGEPVEAVTDANGNFVAELAASEQINATFDGQSHLRDVQIDHRSLPRRELVVDLDRPWAATGDVVRVQVADPTGGWPHAADVVLDTPNGRLFASVGPHTPAVFHVPIPAMDRTAGRFALHASLTESGRITMAAAELFVGRSAVQLELESEAERGVSGERFAFEARASDLGGQPVDGPIRLSVYGSDGNRALGAARHTFETQTRSGRVAVQLPLVGPGPWMIRAQRGGADAELVVWSRARPPALSRRGELAILPRANRVRTGEPLAIDVRVPGGGEAWLTFEQGGVILDQRVPSAAGSTRVTFTVPSHARGLASLVLAHVHGGQVRTASATVEVETSRPMTLDVDTAQTIYGVGETARVTIEAKTDDQQPHDAVVSLWLADAGYWGLGEERYPSPPVYLRLPGRPASGGDSQSPIAYGAEEGRRLDSELIFDGRRLDEATHRHGWRHGGEVIRASATGSLAVIATAIARAARLAGADVRCEEHTDQHTLSVRDLPWDLVALRIGGEVGADVGIGDTGRLVFECGGGGFGGLGMGGAGSGGGGIGLGTIGGIGSSREERLEGTLYFVGLERLGPDGRIELDVPLPDHPGRWRVEVLAIADDGGGARGHRVLHTRDGMEAWVDLTSALRPGDRAEGAIRVQSHTGESHAEVTLEVPAGLRLIEAPPGQIALDSSGHGSAPFTIEALQPGLATVVLDARTPQRRDRVRAAIDVLPPTTQRALFVGAIIGPRATELDVPLPELASATSLRVDLGASSEREVAELFEALTESRWDHAVMRADRLASLAALRRAAHAGGAPSIRARIDLAIASELTALADFQTSNGEIGWGDHPDPVMTLEVLEHVPEGLRSDWINATAQLGRRLSAGELHGEALARALRLLPVEQNLNPLLSRALQESQDIGGLSMVVLAAAHHHRAEIQRRAADQLIDAIEARLAHRRTPASCAGWAFYLCFARRGERGQLARAVLALARAGDPRAASLTARVGDWIAGLPAQPSRFEWGSDEPDVLELITTQPRGTDRVEVILDGQRVSLHDGRVSLPAGSHRLGLRFAERTGRLRRVVVSGDAEAIAPSTAQGNVQLDRRFARRDGRWEGTVSFQLPRRTRDITVDIPLPAGLTVDQRQLRERRASIVAGMLRMRLDELPAGPHSVEIPMVPTGRGEFTAGPAHLMAGEGSLYGLTPAARVVLSQ